MRKYERLTLVRTHAYLLHSLLVPKVDVVDGTETGADADPCASVDWESVDACVYANSQLSVTCKSGFDSYNSNSKKCRGKLVQNWGGVGVLVGLLRGRI